jgi:hypothetical protein
LEVIGAGVAFSEQKSGNVHDGGSLLKMIVPEAANMPPTP